MPIKPCEHASFKMNGEVTRLSDVLDGPITGYSVDVRVSCDVCGLPFHFMGLPSGLSPDWATMSVDQLEARLPIVPGPLKGLLTRFAEHLKQTSTHANNVMQALQGKDIDA